MKPAIVFSLLLLVLLSCHHESADPDLSLPQANPLSATYINSKTGDKLADEFFEYNSDGKIISNAYQSYSANTFSHATYYYYDTDGNLVKQMDRAVNISVPYNIAEYTYEGGLKKTEKLYTEGVSGQQLTEFFYSQRNLPDSSVAIGDYPMNNHYKDVRIFSYDNSNHLILETMYYDGFFVGKNEYTYEGSNLVKSCDPNCFVHDYNKDGLLVKSTLLFATTSRLAEERFYTGKRLDEKWIYVYDESNDPTGPYKSITKIKYEY